jgi:hypothetical protein
MSVAGGGPPGLMLALPLARQGIQVVLLEKHADFLRDFGGDTVHPSTMDLLDELGLRDDAKCQYLHPRRLRPVPGRPSLHPVPAAMAPAESAGSGGERHENFTLPRSHEVTDVIRDRLLALACDPRSHRSGRKPFRVDLELVSFGPVRRNPPTAAARLRAGMMKSPTRSEHLYPDLESVRPGAGC